MIVSGLTILRNAVTLDYPFSEAIRSALPLCDEFLVVVGKSEDRTLEAVKALNDPKIRVIETEWSDKVTPRKCLLAQQTNVGLHQCRGDWVVYLQANEVLHQASFPRLRTLMEEYRSDTGVEALLLERLTFWGDYNHCIAVYPERFKFTARIVKPYVGMYSIRDAMSFGVFDGFSLRGRYPRAVDSGERVYRYGFACTASHLRKKAKVVVHEIGCADEGTDAVYFYTAMPRQFIRRFGGRHPAVMEERVRSSRLSISLDNPNWRTDLTMKEWIRILETKIYERFGVPRSRNTRYTLVHGYRPKPDVFLPDTSESGSSAC